MAEPLRPVAVPVPGSDEDRLESWKEIAAYLGREVRTVQGWEKNEGLPVHRHQHARQGSIYAFRSELDLWRQQRRGAPDPPRAEDAAQRRPSLRLTIAIASTVLVLSAVAVWLVLARRASPPAPPSLVVLPFVDMSPGHDQEYFSDGLTEEIIDGLSRVSGLRVVARTSAFAFKGRNADIRQIGRDLNVTDVLEGSVRKDGNHIRVTAQLNRASDGYHVWSQTWDRDLRDIFAVQRDISQAIANQYSAGQVPARSQTQDLEALRLYQEGRYFFNQHIPPDSYRKAIERYQQALARDPAFAQAWAALSEAWAYLGENISAAPREVMPEARKAALKSLQLDPGLAEGHIALGTVELDYDWNRRGADDEFHRAMALAPGSGYARHWYAHALEAERRLPEAMKEMRAALALDPLSVPIHWDIGNELRLAGQTHEAFEFMQPAVELYPDNPVMLAVFQWACFADGHIAEGHRTMESLKKFPQNPAIMAFVAYGEASLGRRDEALRTLDELDRRRAGEYVDAAPEVWIAEALGDVALQRKWLRRARDEHSPFFIYIPLERRLDQRDPEIRQILASIP